jgi:hypothetical protein
MEHRSADVHLELEGHQAIWGLGTPMTYYRRVRTRHPTAWLWKDFCTFGKQKKKEGRPLADHPLNALPSAIRPIVRAIQRDWSYFKRKHLTWREAYPSLEKTARLACMSLQLRPFTCPTCGGVGFRPEFSHIDEGRCYTCDGKGKVRGPVERLI